MSVPVTLSDLERWDATAQIFQTVLNNARTVWIRKTKFGRITHVGERHISTNPEFFTIHPSSPPLWRFSAEIAAIRRLYIGLRVRYMYYRKSSRFGLAWIRPRADRSLSRPTSVFRTTTGVCNILSRSVEIWQYEGQKPVVE